MGICKLCLKEKQLIKSHIIPEFLYQELFDENHKIFSFNPLEIGTEMARIKRPSSGEWESNLLCSECDTNVIGSYETYASIAMYGGLLHQNESPIVENFVNQEGIHFTNCKNIDYKKFKIFLLSILWRASISSRQIFSRISLGVHEEQIRQMLLTGNPGDTMDYPIFLMTYKNDNTMPNDFIGQPPGEIKSNGLTVFIFMIAGMVYCFYMNSKEIQFPVWLLEQTIKPINEMNIIHLPKGKALEVFKGLHGLK